jgi:tRNA nucleotidyltransferase/poly(A) polymerase
VDAEEKRDNKMSLIYKRKIKEKAQEISNRSLCPCEVKDIFKCLASYRYLKEEFMYYPDLVLEELFSEEGSCGYVYIPSDVIDLRHILKNGIPPISKYLFSLKFIKKHLLDHPILIGYPANRDHIGGLYIIDDDSRDQAELAHVFVREDFENKQKIFDIVKDETPNIETSIITEIPAMRLTKANKSFNLKKYAQSETQIQLTDQENKIFSFLLSVKNSFSETKDVELRVAGGWVRDKLLGLESDDIDIAINNMTGYDFAKYIGQYAQVNSIPNVGEPYQVSLDKVVDKTEESPDENLSVGGINIFGDKIEFVQFRTEKYTPESRKPIVAPTNDVREDVVRRDLTINALYYNVETGQVEDYVGGEEDLKNMELKTPVDPMKTFSEDPLRMLRVLRFYSRYPNAKIDPAIIDVMKTLKDPESELSKIYKSKVHPSRAAKEIRKIMESDRSVDGARLLFETGLYRHAFQIPEDWLDIDMDQQSPFHNLTLMEHTLKVMEHYNDVAKETGIPAKERGLMMLSTMLHDFGKMNPKVRVSKKDKQGVPATFQRGETPIERKMYMKHDFESADFAKRMMTSMGFEPHEKKFVETVIRHHMAPHNFSGMKPKTIGKFLAKTNEFYKHILDHAYADSLSKGDLSEAETAEIKQNRERQLKAIEEYREQMGDLVHKPVIDGVKIKQLVQEIEPEMVAQNATIMSTRRYGNRPVHFMTYIIDALKEQQWMQRVMTAEQAEVQVKGIAKQFANLWRQQMKETDKQANIKQADASSGQGPEGYDGYEEGIPALERSHGVVRMNRDMQSQYKEGQRVRYVMGLAFEPIEGRIVSLKDNAIIVEWTNSKYKGTKKAFDLTDTISLAKLDII